MEILAGIVKVLLAIILITAAVAKLRSPIAFRQFLRHLGVPKRAVRGSSWLIASTEAGIGLLLLVGNPTVAGAATAALFGAFALVLLKAGSDSVPCGCFGSSRTSPSAARRDLLLAPRITAGAAGAFIAAEPQAGPLAVACLGLTMCALVVWIVSFLRSRRSATEQPPPLHQPSPEPSVTSGSIGFRQALSRRRFFQRAGQVLAGGLATAIFRDFAWPASARAVTLTAEFIDTDTTCNSGSLTFSKPVLAAPGDLLLGYIQSDGGVASWQATGWTKVFEDNTSIGTTALFYKFVQPGESSYSFSDGQSPSYTNYGAVLAYSGDSVDTVAPIAAVTLAKGSASSLPPAVACAGVLLRLIGIKRTASVLVASAKTRFHHCDERFAIQGLEYPVGAVGEPGIVTGSPWKLIDVCLNPGPKLDRCEELNRDCTACCETNMEACARSGRDAGDCAAEHMDCENACAGCLVACNPGHYSCNHYCWD